MKIPRIMVTLAAIWTLAFWCVCVGVPMAVLLGRVRVWSGLWDDSLLAISRVTLIQALASAGISGIIGLPLGLWIGGRADRGGFWAEMLLALPFGVPTVVAGLVWVMWLGRAGLLARAGLPLDWAYSFKAVVLAHVVFNSPFVALLVAQARLFVPESRIEAARTLGAGLWARFRTVGWPQVRWAFWSACAQVWAFCAMSFALVLVLGGGPPVQTLETALYSRVRYGPVDLEGAILCAVWELIITLFPWALVLIFESGRDRIEQLGHQRSAAGFRVRLPARARDAARAAVAALFFIPYLAVFFGVTAWSGLWSSAGEVIASLKISVLLAACTALGTVATAVAAVIAVTALRATPRIRATATVLLSLPSGISVLVLGLGFWLAYRRWIDPFSGSLSAMIALQITLFFSVSFRILWPVAQDSQRRLLEVAATLGASPWRAFRAVEWPRWKIPLWSALGLVAGASLGEVAAVSLFYNEKLIPLPLLIARWMAQYRFGEAQGVAALLLVMTTAAIGSAYGVRRWKPLS